MNVLLDLLRVNPTTPLAPVAHPSREIYVLGSSKDRNTRMTFEVLDTAADDRRKLVIFETTTIDNTRRTAGIPVGKLKLLVELIEAKYGPSSYCGTKTS